MKGGDEKRGGLCMNRRNRNTRDEEERKAKRRLLDNSRC